ncbi:MAG: hypothetical protein JJU06_17865 [Ectothiorhodospiraceae bacterium]|nr:hypothetical protein [Ectothiorhodospiraceae bacterium]MCH8506459.1 hypothetical protein [Ectothiorhodospiraceae bacterium]
MAVWTCELRPEAVARLKEYLPEGRIPRQVQFEVADKTPEEEIRREAANALFAKVSAWGGNYEQEILMALADRDSMRCSVGNGDTES